MTEPNQDIPKLSTSPQNEAGTPTDSPKEKSNKAGLVSSKLLSTHGDVERTSPALSPLILPVSPIRSLAQSAHIMSAARHSPTSTSPNDQRLRKASRDTGGLSSADSLNTSGGFELEETTMALEMLSWGNNEKEIKVRSRRAKSTQDKTRPILCSSLVNRSFGSNSSRSNADSFVVQLANQLNVIPSNDVLGLPTEYSEYDSETNEWPEVSTKKGFFPDTDAELEVVDERDLRSMTSQGNLLTELEQVKAKANDAIQNLLLEYYGPDRWDYEKTDAVDYPNTDDQLNSGFLEASGNEQNTRSTLQRRARLIHSRSWPPSLLGMCHSVL